MINPWRCPCHRLECCLTWGAGYAAVTNGVGTGIFRRVVVLR